MADDLSFDILAAGLRRDVADLDTFIEVLAKRMEATLPHLVSAVRAGLFGKKGPVRQLSLTFDQWQYGVNRDHGRLVFTRTKLVRGVGIKNEVLDLDEWIKGLAQELMTVANARQEAREALERFLLS